MFVVGLLLIGISVLLALSDAPIFQKLLRFKILSRKVVALFAATDQRSGVEEQPRSFQGARADGLNSTEPVHTWWSNLIAPLHDPRLTFHRGPIALICVPSFAYFMLFDVVMHPIFAVFSTQFWTDTGDGMSGVWNIWWANKAVMQLHQLPWQTNFLHYPYGVNLLGDTLTPFDGFIGIPLLRLFSLVQTYNIVLTFTFVAAGTNAFLLGHHLTRSYVASLVGGFVFAFTSFHFSHAQLHLHTASLEWIPLFILFWYRTIFEWRVLWAVLSALALVLTLLCDYYFFMFCVESAAILFAWAAFRNMWSWSLAVQRTKVLIVFAISSLILDGPLVFSFLRLNRDDPLLGAHDPVEFSLDLLSPIIPGSTWQFADLTQQYWKDFLSPVENSGYLGVVVLICAVYVGVMRLKGRSPGVGIWYVIGLVFMALSLGPIAHLRGAQLSLPVPLPFTLFQNAFPVLQLSGDPARMIVITTMCAAVIVAHAYKLLLAGSSVSRLVAVLLTIVLWIEYLPHPLGTSSPQLPPWMQAIQGERVHGPVVDMYDRPQIQVYFVAALDTPFAFGYIARTPTSVWEADQKVALEASLVRGDVLRRYGFRYFVGGSGTGYDANPRLYADREVSVYQLWKRVPGTRVQYTKTQPDERAGEILSGHSLGQTFTAQHDGLAEVGFYLTNYGHTMSGPLVFHLRDAAAPPRGPDLARVVTDLTSLPDNTVKIFHFAPIQGSSGRHFYAYLTAPKSSLGHAPSAAGSVHSTYSGGTMMIDRSPQHGDLVIQLFYKGSK